MILKKFLKSIKKLKEILVVFMINFVLRSISSLVLAPLFLWIAYINNIFFHLLLLIVFTISLYELKFVLIKKKIFYIFLFFLILGFLFSTLGVRGYSNNGFYYFLWIMLIVWLSDIGGYLFGNIFKGPALSKWSPKKTFSGLFGSLTLAQFAFLIPSMFGQGFEYTLAIFLSQFFLAIIATLGDLFFSFIKRSHNIKDYSNLIPGHGGLLDRIDGMIFVMIFAYFLKIYGY
jgi:phosphatidate cytidylyltransferase